MNLKPAPNGKIYLNLGCGSHFFRDWNNLDLISHPDVVAYDVRDPLPLADATVDVTYSSHVLEHLPPEQGRFFLSEQFRVLKSGGVCRVAVPDLERICRDYLAQLEKVALHPTPENQLDYQWGVYQLLDQMVREQSGGEMGRAISQGAYTEFFLRSRFGDELLSPAKKNQEIQPTGAALLFRKVRNRLTRLFQPRSSFRETGEVHRWMYDRHSLPLLLVQVGFESCAIKSHLESNIPSWENYNLDLAVDRVSARKPDSIFVEGRKK